MNAIQNAAKDPFTLAGKSFGSRLLIGTAGYPNRQVMLDALAISGAEIVTVSIRRVSTESHAENLWDVLKDRCHLLPNTAGCGTVRDAVLTAQLGREAVGTDWVKLELIGDRETLYPDVAQLVEAAEELVKDGFIVLPYCTDDPVVCQKLADVGCAAVMPLASPIGSGMGLVNPYNLEMVCNRSTVPVIVDAGIGTASDAARAMEIGADAVLLNTAISKARNPVLMAAAMRDAVAAGRAARRAGRIPRKGYAEASSPQLGMIGS
ncbi:thiazole synthase [Oceanibaculum nanhaiense]|uniref:thiazole synthase n=1 Tax=Oceanibaculum nanhaiense TaxID=1909734 RepID=UPI00396F0C72